MSHPRDCVDRFFISRPFSVTLSNPRLVQNTRLPPNSAMSKYVEAHTHPKGPGDARPTALEIVKDEELEDKLSGKVVFITGTSSGIGIETVRAIAATGAKVFCTVRDIKKGEAALNGIGEADQVELLAMDNTSLASVRAAVEDFKSRSDKLNILINNAGTYPTSTTCTSLHCVRSLRSLTQESWPRLKASRPTTSSSNSGLTTWRTSFSSSCSSPSFSPPQPHRSTPASSTSHPPLTASSR